MKKEMPGLPSRINIGGHTYSVEACESDDFSDDACFGECDYVQQRIRVLHVLHPQTFRKVLWHEAGEAIRSHDSLEMEHETMTVAFNRALGVLDDNPKLREFLWGKR